jgi:hypothetical protein
MGGIAGIIAELEGEQRMSVPFPVKVDTRGVEQLLGVVSGANSSSGASGESSSNGGVWAERRGIGSNPVKIASAAAKRKTIMA